MGFLFEYKKISVDLYFDRFCL